MNDNTKEEVRPCYLLLGIIRGQAVAKEDFKHLTRKLLLGLIQVVRRSIECYP